MVGTKSDGQRKSNQFSLRSLLLMTASVGVFLGLVSLGWYKVAFWFVVSYSFCLMAIDVVSGRVNRKTAIGLLVAAIVFAAVNVGIFFVVWSWDSIVVMSPVYVFSVIFGGAGLTVIASIMFAIFRPVYWLSLLGFILWVGCVGFAHLFFVAELSAMV